jgi:hypothetical protein
MCPGAPYLKTLAIGTALAGLAGVAGAGIGSPVIAPGGELTVTILPATAAYTNMLYLTDGAGLAAPVFIASNKQVGDTVLLGTFEAGTELVFMISVLDTGDKFYTGEAGRNFDGLEHANVMALDHGTIFVGFEDQEAGGDRDYDDACFELARSVPAPGALTLAGAGALTLLRRRR